MAPPSQPSNAAQRQTPPSPRPARAHRRAFTIVWLSAGAVSIAVAKLLPGVLAGPSIVLAAFLASYLLSRREQRQRERDAEGIDEKVRTIGEVASPRYNAPTRRGPVTAADTPLPFEDDTGPEPHDLAWLAERVELQRERVDAKLEWYMQARAALRAIIDGIDAPVFATDERGLIRLVNRHGDRMFRRRAGRLAGLEFEELFTQSAVLDLHAEAQKGVAGREQVRIPVEGLPRTFEVSAAPVRMDIAHLPAQTPQRAGVVITLRDVTELSRADQLKTDFVANASHELRTPIASIRAAVETFRGPAAADAGMRERLVRMIDTNIVRLEEMVSDLLDLSHLESPDPAPRRTSVSLIELRDAFVTMFAAVCAQRRLTLDFTIEPELETIRSDPKLLQLILRNLIDNATKFAFEGTAVRIDIRRGEPGPNRNAITIDPSDDLDAPAPKTPPPANARPVVISVTDRGVGIPLKHQQRIFERFYQVDESRTRQGVRRGTGLGLAIVKHAVRVLGGEIAIESVWQEGTTLTVTLPTADDEEEVAGRPIPGDPPEASA